MREAVLLKERTQGLEAGLIDIGEEARERGAVRQLLAAKERHEGTSKGGHPLEKRCQSAFETSGIAKEHGEKIDYLVVTHAPACQMHLVTQGLEDPTASQVVGQQSDFCKPGGQRGNVLGASLDSDGSGGSDGHKHLLQQISV